MFIHLGEDVVIPLKDIISIMNLESSSYSKKTKEFLDMAKEEGFLKKISDKKPKSFIFTIKDNQTIIYLSPISSITLLKRSRFVEDNIIS